MFKPLLLDFCKVSQHVFLFPEFLCSTLPKLLTFGIGNFLFAVFVALSNFADVLLTFL